MTVKIIRKNKGAEVTDKMLIAIANTAQKAQKQPTDGYPFYAWNKNVLRQAMEAARETEIEKIEVNHQEDKSAQCHNFIVKQMSDNWIEFINLGNEHNYIAIKKDDIIPLTEALLELERQIGE